jgi:hypothetical protein
MTIIFPQHPFEKGKVDPDYQVEYSATVLYGFNTIMFDFDAFITEGKIALKKGSGKAIYRGWMMKDWQYERFYNQMRLAGYQPITNVDQYAQYHYYPNIHDNIPSQYRTKATWCASPYYRQKDTQEVAEWLALFEGKPVIIKDYVKSEKGTDLFMLDTTNPEAFKERMLAFTELRGKLFNKGIVLKEVIDLKRYDGYTNEWRMFIVNNRIISFTYNVDAPDTIEVERPTTDIIKEFWVKNQHHANFNHSNFFTMDIAQKSDGSWFVLEFGDGQVSGLTPTQNVNTFYNNLLRIHNGEI